MEYNENPWWSGFETLESNILEEYIGFVYEITNLTNNRKYIGKKLLRRTKRKQVKGRVKKFLVESDWKEYWGSNKELLDDIAKLGYTKFERKILRLCKSKGECSYYEAKEQFCLDVLLRPEEYYNTWMSVRVRREHLKGLVSHAEPQKNDTDDN